MAKAAGSSREAVWVRRGLAGNQLTSSEMSFDWARWLARGRTIQGAPRGWGCERRASVEDTSFLADGCDRCERSPPGPTAFRLKTRRYYERRRNGAWIKHRSAASAGFRPHDLRDRFTA